MVSVVFLLFDHGEKYDFFIFSDEPLSVKQYVWYLGEHLVLVFTGIAAVKYAIKYRISAKTFMWICTADTVDYCLTYGESWFGGPATFNLLKCATFGISIAYDYQKHVGSNKSN